MKTTIKPTPQRSNREAQLSWLAQIAPTFRQADMEPTIPIKPTPTGGNPKAGQKSVSSLSNTLALLRYTVMLIVLLGASFAARADQFYYTRTAVNAVDAPNIAQMGYTRLWIWNDATNTQTFRAVLRSGASAVYVDGIATQPTTGTLFGFVNDDITNAGLLPIVGTNIGNGTNMRSRLATINPTTGAVTVLGSSWLSNRMITGAGFDPLGRLWVTDAAQRQILQINPTTGAIIGTPINTPTIGGTSIDLDFSASGLGIIAFGGLNFYLFNPLTGSINGLSTNSTSVGFDSSLIPPYSLVGIAFTSNLAARNGGTAATSCRFNIVENRGTDQLGMVNDPFTISPSTVRAEAAQSADPNGGPMDNGGPGDMARVGGPFFAACLSDFGDAPVSYEQGNRAEHTYSIYMNLGTELDIETGPQSTTNATGDDLLDTDDEDALSVVPSLQRLVGGGNVPYTITVPVRNELGSPLTLTGFLDADQNGVFNTTTERSTVTVPATGSNSDCVSTGTNTWSCTLSWSMPVANTSLTTTLRLRLGAASDYTSGLPTGKVASGEVEDYQVCVAPLITSNISSTTVCSGDLVPITFTTTPTGQPTVWSRSGGTSGSVMGGGNVNSVLTNDGTTPVSYTYAAWSPAQGPTGCSSNTVTVSVTVNPRPVVIPSVCSQTICSGQTGAITFISSVPGSTINWTRTPTTPAPSSGTGDISQSLINTGPTSVTYTYQVWATTPAPASCPSSATITCTIVVTPGLQPILTTVVPGGGCIGEPLSLSATAPASALAPVNYVWTGPNAFNQTGSSVLVSNAATLTNSGSYTVTVTDATGCSGTATLPVSVSNCCSLTATAGTPLVICATGTLNLSVTAGNSTTDPVVGPLTYRWTGPNSFTATIANPTLASVSATASGVYSVTVTDGQNCTAISSVNVTITPAPTAGATSNSPVCPGGTLQLSASGGVSYTWFGPNGFTQTGQTVLVPGVTSVNAGSYTVVVTDATGCTATTTTTVVVPPPGACDPSCPNPLLSYAGQPLCTNGVATPTYSPLGGGFAASPMGLVIDPVTGVLNLNASAAGTYTVTYTVQEPTSGCIRQVQTFVTVVSTPYSNAVTTNGGN